MIARLSRSPIQLILAVLAFLALVSLIPALALPQPQVPAGTNVKHIQGAPHSHVRLEPASSATAATGMALGKPSATRMPSKPPADSGNDGLFVQGSFPNSTTCTNPKIRKEWRRMTKAEQKEWIRAVTCMHEKPPKYRGYFRAVQHRYDDFVAMHINATGMVPGTHNTGYFLPFHRYLLWIWENVLHAECGYNGTTPWWDWSLDTPERGGHFVTSPIFHPTHGFGGDGKAVVDIETEPRCLTNGPWAKFPLRVNWDDQQRGARRCLERDFHAALAEASASPARTLNDILARDDYEDFSALDFAAEGYRPGRGGPHAVGHLGVGGEMANLYSSTNDPLFWVHHGGIDQFWTRWQGRNRTRLEDVVASTIEFHTIGQVVPTGRKAGTTTMDSLLFHVGKFAPIIPICQVMDTLNEDGNGFLCYKYDA